MCMHYKLLGFPPITIPHNSFSYFRLHMNFGIKLKTITFIILKTYQADALAFQAPGWQDAAVQAAADRESKGWKSNPKRWIMQKVIKKSLIIFYGKRI